MLTFWGSFDKIPEPHRYINEYQPKFVAMSLPIFAYKEQVLSSPLLDVDERCWYFTKAGIFDWMRSKGFSLLSVSADDDRKYGLDGYQSFVFASDTIVT
jgi:hypothetical protein